MVTSRQKTDSEKLAQCPTSWIIIDPHTSSIIYSSLKNFTYSRHDFNKDLLKDCFTSVHAYL